ncbi:hypothetical protein [Levilactobacillus acidifarinae]|uniref:Uncharacterized protein n=1 Tax=Levilactobacillus acidifarinae DSM 19394 = JCM 15949 TaxID=1423715 RepID=A0A0R1LGP2_9LACO|nr:hypothetical protein [Levilactobacillus acidifarinae]KRK95004.1 hypothetical protein FD25_GL002189 [Levilactobacillus acidifarinae DSM 19394]GEO70773.1 hypothetical protein LAC03_26830 [Levilactobacillus acidifarinae]
MKMATSGVSYDNCETVTTSFNEIARIVPYVWTDGFEYNKFRPNITPLNQVSQLKMKRNILQKSLRLLSKTTTWRRYNSLYPNQGLDGNDELDFKKEFDFWYMDVVILIVVASTYPKWSGKSSLLGADNLKYGKRTSRRKLATGFYDNLDNCTAEKKVVANTPIKEVNDLTLRRLRANYELSDIELEWRNFFDFLYGYSSVDHKRFDKKINFFSLSVNTYPQVGVDNIIRMSKEEDRVSVPNPFLQFVWLDSLFNKEITEDTMKDFESLQGVFSIESEVSLKHTQNVNDSSSLLFQLVAMLYPQSQEKLRRKLELDYKDHSKRLALESPLMRSYICMLRGGISSVDIEARPNYQISYGMLNTLARPLENKGGALELARVNDDTLRKLVKRLRELHRCAAGNNVQDVDSLKSLKNKFRAININTRKWRKKWGEVEKKGIQISLDLSNLPSDDVQMIRKIECNIEETRDIISMGQTGFTIWWEDYEVDLATLLD